MSEPPVTKADITRKLVALADRLLERWEAAEGYDQDTDLLKYAITAYDSAYQGAAVYDPDDPEIKQIAGTIRPALEEES